MGKFSTPFIERWERVYIPLPTIEDLCAYLKEHWDTPWVQELIRDFVKEERAEAKARLKKHREVLPHAGK